MPRKVKLVKVERPIVPFDGLWRATDEAQEHSEEFEPDQWLRDCMGARMKAFVEAVWSAQGWQFRRIIRKDLHW